MSAAATAAGYLYASGRLTAAGHNRRADEERVEEPAEEPAAESASPPAKAARTPRIEYRKRRAYALPSAA